MNHENITNKQMLDTLMQAITELKEEVNDKIEEAKREIKLENQKLLQKAEDHAVKINKLTDKCENIEQRYIKIEREIRKNNILIFGLEVPENKNLVTFTLEKLTELTGVELHDLDINNIHKLKAEGTAPIKVEFNRFLKKELLLQNCHKLKGSKIIIVHDLCPEDRADQKVLRQHLNEAKSKHYLARIKRNTLIVNNEVFTVQDLRRIEAQEDYTNNIVEKVRSSSEPTTPRSKISELISNEIENNVNSWESSTKDVTNTQELTQTQENQEERKRTDKRPNTSPADPRKEEKTKIIRTNSTSSTKSDKVDRPKRTAKQTT